MRLYNNLLVVIFILCTFISSCGKVNDNSIHYDSLATKSASLSNQQVSDSLRLSTAQQDAISLILKDSIGWRTAQTSDNSNPFLKKQQQEQPDYQPYFIEADIDHNGKKDFIITLLREKDTTFAIFLFRQLDGNYSTPQHIVSSRYLSTSGLFFIDGTLKIGEFYTDNCVIFRWDSLHSKMVEINYDDKSDY